MEKVKLTQEQENCIHELLNNQGRSPKYVLVTHIECTFFKSDAWAEKFKCFNNLSVDDMAKVLYTPNSYEVIPQYKVGDWVIFEYKAVRVIGEILEIETDEFFTAKVDDPKYQVPQNIALSKLRHATPEEIQQEKKRRFWDKLGREVDEWKEGDIVFNESTKQMYQVPIGGLIAAKVVSFKLICPVEQRLDK
ncbi:hypothetical protein J18TS1_12070 [Oceanobacillus oncorhynchi subsp. incaldanensis]|uniref:hypothetical protein n=1 Tax=Oceanobacillus oncorhynchi TaxID=545501 RepID=UPI001B1A5F67|nr:hypothetical protein [Oceanobacillus oncorhynchi]GIO18107.1 hypothetical protein J18TS1_12070 [Oceanobacillus oncorhynchi subsp. incaldanensis]